MTPLDVFISTVNNLILQATKGKIAPPVPLDPSNPSPEASEAAKKMLAASQDPNTQLALRQRYETTYGFTNHLRRGSGKTIWEPWNGVTPPDLDATIKVAGLLEVPPEHVLALWIQEGKITGDDIIHGSATWPMLVVNLTADVTLPQLRSYVRSLILYQFFGTDAFTAYIATPGSDNQTKGPEADHDSAFDRTFASLAALNLNGPAQMGARTVRDYLTSPGGAFLIEQLKDFAGNPISGTIAMGFGAQGSIRLRSNSVATWLYLQHALFLHYQKQMEDKFDDEYEGHTELSDRPWVTYLGWNAGVTGQYRARFQGKSTTPDQQIEALFGEPPAQPLRDAEKTLYYDPNGSRSALGNAIQYKYLTESLQPWFG